MLRRTVLLTLVLFCILFTVDCAVEEVEAKLGSFEGTYTSPRGFGLFICEDEGKIQGSYDEVGILWGELSADKKNVTGRFVEAGFGPCSKGNFEITLTSDGFEGTIICTSTSDDSPRKWVERKKSLFRPSDNHCALRYSRKDLTVEGRWTNSNGLFMDVCFVESRRSYESVHISLRHATSNGNVVDWYVLGDHLDNGKVVQGTWYQNFTAGAFLLYIREGGELEYIWWTGLVGTNGNTYIDSNQYYDITRHGIGHYRGPRQSILASDCTRNEILRPLVRQNLHQDDDDNFYYFVQTKYLDSGDFLYHKEPVLFAAADHVYISLLLSFACLFLIL